MFVNPLIHHIEFLPTYYVIRYKKGERIAGGPGLSFYYVGNNTAVAAIPMSVMDADFIFEESTKDFQAVSVQGQITYRIADYEHIASMLNFTIDMKTQAYNDTPLNKLSKRLTNIANVMVKNRVSDMPLSQAIQAERTLARDVLKEMQTVKEISDIGIEITGFSILRIAASNDTHRALEAHTREAILKKSDDALYERRNASIEQERKVKENELNTEISVEEKKKQIREAEIATKRMVLEKENELERIRIAGDIEQERIETAAKAELEQAKIDAQIEIEAKRKELAEIKLENAKKEADAEAYRVGVVMEAYNRLNPDTLIALATMNMEPERMIAGAFEKLAVNSEKIGSLNITPDLLESLKVS